MKKLLALFAVLLTGIGFASCTGTIEDFTFQKMSSKESLATLSYLSSGFLNLEEKSLIQTTSLSLEKQALVEDELDEINKYVSLLKSFIDHGPDGFAKIDDLESDRPDYQYLLNMSVNDNVFKLYYNVDIQSKEITGIFIIDDIEYEIIAHTNLDDFEDFNFVEDQDSSNEEVTTEEVTTEEVITEEETTMDEDSKESTSQLNASLLSDDDDDEDDDDFDKEEDDDDEDDDEDEYDDSEEEINREMTLLAKNGQDTITIKYEFEADQEEESTEFEIIKNINGIETIIEIEIEIEEDEYSLEIRDGDNYYEFSIETEDQEVEYELEYRVDGVSGEIEISEFVDEEGNLYYEYEIEEEGQISVIEKEDSFDDDDDLDDEDDGEDDDDEDDQDNQVNNQNNTWIA